MLPFAISRRPRENNNTPEDFNYEASILVMAKKVGLSFEELNLMTLQDFVDFIDLWMEEPEEETERMATQQDIDSFYS